MDLKIDKSEVKGFKRLLEIVIKALSETKPVDFRDIKTYEDACEARPVDKEDKIYSTDSSDIIAYKKLKHLRKAICPDFIVDWTNGNQQKWYPWFNLSSGFGFGDSNYNCSHTDAGVGSRLCLPTEEISNYFGKQFIDLYEELIIIKV